MNGKNATDIKRSTFNLKKPKAKMATFNKISKTNNHQ